MSDNALSSHLEKIILLAKDDMSRTCAALMNISPCSFRRLEKEEGSVLLAIVGDGMNEKKGVAARCFSAISYAELNIEIISFGPSKTALYFLLHESDFSKVINAIYTTFFH